MLKNLWKICLLKLKKHISEYEFNIWILPLQVKINNNIINLYSPNKFIINYIKKNYLNYINNFFIKSLKYNLNIKPYFNFIIGSKNNIKNNLLNNNINKNENIFDLNNSNNSNIFKNYNFNNFIFNESNILAYKECINLCNLSNKYKFLFIYGKTCLGKTHLLNAIVNKVNLLYNYKKKIFYVNMKSLLNKMKYFLYKNSVKNFVHYIKSISIFLIDDIQYLCNKNYIQIEFLNLLNILLYYKKYIVLTSNCNIYNLKNINDKLIYKLNYSLKIKIHNANSNLKYNFLIKKCNYINLFLDNNILLFISKNFNLNFIELENILYLIYINAINLNYINKINIDFIKKILYKFIDYNNKLNIKIYNIQKIVCNYYNITINNLLSKHRYKSFVWPRQIAITLSKDLTDYSLLKLGSYFGNLSHSYILYSYNKIKKLCLNNCKVRLEFNNLIKLIMCYKNEIYYKKKKVN